MYYRNATTLRPMGWGSNYNITWHNMQVSRIRREQFRDLLLSHLIWDKEPASSEGEGCMVTGWEKILQDFQRQAIWMADIFSRLFFFSVKLTWWVVCKLIEIVWTLMGCLHLWKFLWICNESCFPKIHHNANHFEKKYTCTTILWNKDMTNELANAYIHVRKQAHIYVESLGGSKFHQGGGKK